MLKQEIRWGRRESKGPCENVLLMVLGEMNSLDYISSFNAVPGLNILSCSAVGKYQKCISVLTHLDNDQMTPKTSFFHFAAKLILRPAYILNKLFS